ncbi:MAG: cohesin domain-containing protein [Burkholderiales bacterium]
MSDSAAPRPALLQASTRWIIYGVVLALALIAIRVTEQPEGQAAAARARTQVEPYRTAGPPAPGAARVPALELERLGQRAQRDTHTGLVNARSWEALEPEEARRNAPLPAPPPAPQAPPLPFAFLGQLVEEGRVTVFLTNGDRNWVVREGDTIDGAYRVEAIADRTMTLTYLALNTRQELAIGSAPPYPRSVGAPSISEALPVAVSPGGGAPLPGQVALLLAAPSRVAAGNALVVSIGLPPGDKARTARVELAYDPKVLAAVDAPATGSGRLTLELSGATGPLAQARFRAIAQSPTNTQIRIENAIATDARGASVAMATPGAHDVAIVGAQGAK